MKFTARYIFAHFVSRHKFANKCPLSWEAIKKITSASDIARWAILRHILALEDSLEKLRLRFRMFDNEVSYTVRRGRTLKLIRRLNLGVNKIRQYTGCTRENRSWCQRRGVVGSKRGVRWKLEIRNSSWGHSQGEKFAKELFTRSSPRR